MSVQKRKCSSCAFFNESPLPGNGWCTHPKRQLSSEVRILVRKGELACRDPWGSDYWTSKTESPVAAETGDPVRQAPPDRLVAGLPADDQITSVTASRSSQTAGADRSRTTGQESAPGTAPNDVIVSQPSMLPEKTAAPREEGLSESDQHDLNLPAHEDQRERVRIIARGNRDAIVKARERVVLRRGGGSQGQMADSDDGEEGGERSVDRDDPARFDNVSDSDRFPDDATEPISLRFRRRQGARDSGPAGPSRRHADPTPPVPPEEVANRGRHSSIVSRRSDADRFESVPDVRPDVALPQLRKFLQTTDPDADPGKEADSESGSRAETSYDRVLQRAQAIKTATQEERSAKFSRNRSLRHRAAPVQSTAIHASAAIGDRDGSALSTGSLSSPVGDAVDKGPHPTQASSDDGAFFQDEPGDDDMDSRENIATAFEDDQYPDDSDVIDDDVSYGRTDRSDAGPRDSWWRGLTIGFRRRPDSYTAVSDDAFDIDMDDDPEWTDDAPSDHDQADDDWHTSDDVERVFSFASTRSVTASSRARVRDSRAAEDELIDYELTDEVLETSFADDSDHVQAESWREDNHPGAPQPRHHGPDASRSRQNSSFVLNDQRDMDAFRAALFGRDAATQATPDAARERRSRADQDSQRHQSPAPSREERLAGRDELTDSGTLPPVERQRYVEEPAFDIRNFVEQDGDPLDMRVQIAPEIPRACQTCRNFRPSESGQRGWCTNDFAFTHRQMVDADAMPCQSSIGCWWLPGDASWMPPGELAARNAPTPLTDRLIARRHGHDVRDEHSETGMYVREISTR